MKPSLPEVVQATWLDRVWDELFADGSGLISPRQIRIDGLDRQRVRAAELATIEATEIEAQQLRSGRMLRDVSGQMVDAVAMGDVPMFSIIERAPVDDDVFFARVSRPERVLNSMIADVEQQDLQHSLNFRRTALFAESEIYAQQSFPQLISTLRPSRHWVQRWRQLSQQVFCPELQKLWARLLVQEVAAPGRYPLAIMEALARIDEADLPGIQLLACYSFREFIFDASQRYFQSDLHNPLIAAAARMGLLQAEGHRFWLNFKPRDVQRKPQLLICNNRALQVRTLPMHGLQLPVIRVSEAGKQIFRLCGAHADIAYLMDMAEYLRSGGAEVALGDWGSRDRVFESRLNVA